MTAPEGTEPPPDPAERWAAAGGVAGAPSGRDPPDRPRAACGALARDPVALVAWLTERAREALEDLLGDRGELLSLEVVDGPDVWLLNVTDVADALDEEASEIKRFSNGRFMRAVRYVFDPAALEGRTFFVLAQRPAAGIYVTGAVVGRIRERGLTGAELRQVWP